MSNQVLGTADEEDEAAVGRYRAGDRANIGTADCERSVSEGARVRERRGRAADESGRTSRGSRQPVELTGTRVVDKDVVVSPRGRIGDAGLDDRSTRKIARASGRQAVGVELTRVRGERDVATVRADG